jgi:hypothetical protein
VLKKGVYAPRFAQLPTFGQSTPGEKSALLGFSLVLNGRTDKLGRGSEFFDRSLQWRDQPTNVFTVGPENNDPSRAINYNPLWDAHAGLWTPTAAGAGKVHRIRSMDQQKSLIAQGLLTSADIDPPSPGNPYVGDVCPTQAIINCPVVAHSDFPRNKAVIP